MAIYWLFELFTQVIYHVLLVWLHGLIIVIRRLRFLFSIHDLTRVVRRLAGQFRNKGIFYVDPEKLKKIACELPKRPKHLILILLDKNGQYIEELSNVAIWSICLGTAYITLYSKDGKDNISQRSSSRFN